MKGEQEAGDRLTDPSPGTGEEAGVVTSPEDPPRSAFQPYRPSGRGLVAWLALLAVGVVLDGAVGVVPAFVVALVLVARLPARLIGATGVGAVALALPVALVATEGGDRAVHQEFVTDSMLAHHLTFIGLALVVAGAFLDRPRWVIHGRTGTDAAGHESGDAGPADPWHPALRIAVIALVACSAVAIVAATRTI